MEQEFYPNEFFVKDLLPQGLEDVHVKITANGGIEIFSKRHSLFHTSSNSGIFSNFSFWSNDDLSISITYNYGNIGFGTFLMNTWIVLARYLYEKPEDIRVSGVISYEDGCSYDFRYKYYSQFGFLINQSGKRPAFIIDRLTDLMPVLNKDTREEYWLRPYMFTSEQGELLSNRIAAIKSWRL